MKNELVPSQSACASMFVNISEMISSITSSMDALVMSISVRVAVVVAVSVVTVVTVAVAMVVIVLPLVLLGLVVLLLVTVVVKLVTNAVVWTTEVMDLVLVAVVLMEEVALAAVPELWLAATLVSGSIPGSLCWSDLEMALFTMVFTSIYQVATSYISSHLCCWNFPILDGSPKTQLQVLRVVVVLETLLLDVMVPLVTLLLVLLLLVLLLWVLLVVVLVLGCMWP